MRCKGTGKFKSFVELGSYTRAQLTPLMGLCVAVATSAATR
jgi:hypothetical protein